MARMAKVGGGALLAIGLALLVGFSIFVVRDERFQKAGLLKDRNPGNMLYESQYFAAATIHLFLISGAVAGGLLALNGATFMLLGSVMTWQERSALTARTERVIGEREMRG